MPDRIRSVLPEQWTDETFLSCTPLARLLALAIRNKADDNGVFPWSTLNLKIRLLPADNVDIDGLLLELLDSNQIITYESDGKKYGMIRNFTKFQRPQKPTFIYPIPAALPAGYRTHNKYTLPNYSSDTQSSTPNYSSDTQSSTPNYSSDTPKPPANYNTRETHTPLKGGSATVISKPSRVEESSAEESSADLDKLEAEFTDITFPIKNGEEWTLPLSTFNDFAQTYPDADIKAEMRKAWQWLRVNPKKLKTASGMPSFLNGWLARRKPEAAEPKETEHEFDFGPILGWQDKEKK